MEYVIETIIGKSGACICLYKIRPRCLVCIARMRDDRWHRLYIPEEKFIHQRLRERLEQGEGQGRIYKRVSEAEVDVILYGAIQDQEE